MPIERPIKLPVTPASLVKPSLLVRDDLRMAVGQRALLPVSTVLRDLKVQQPAAQPAAPGVTRLTPSKPTGPLAEMNVRGSELTIAAQDYVQFPPAKFEGMPFPAANAAVALGVHAEPGYLYAVDCALLVQPGGTVVAQQPLAAMLGESRTDHHLLFMIPSVSSRGTVWAHIYSQTTHWGLFEIAVYAIKK